MKFRIQRCRFLEGIKAVQNIVGAKGSLPVLQNVLLEADGGSLKMTTTDLDISIRSEVEAEVIESGKTTLPVKLLFNSISKVVEGDVEVEMNENEKAVIKAGSAKFMLNGIAELEFPRLPQGENYYTYTVTQSVLKKMLSMTSYAASQDDTRRTLKGVLMSFKEGSLTLVATDGRRMALVKQEVEFPVEKEKDIILPFKAVQELHRSLGNEGDIEITVQNSQISFRIGNTVIYSKMIDDVYPNYRQVIPVSCEKTIEVDRQLLINALERASVMSMDEAHSTKLIFKDNMLTVTAVASEVGEVKDEVDIKYIGEEVEIMFNPSYVMDPLKTMDDDMITFNLNDGHSPAVIKCTTNDCFLYVIMPLRVN